MDAYLSSGLWFVLLGNIIEGVGALILSLSILYSLRCYSFGPVSKGLRSVASLIGYSFGLIGITDFAVVARGIFHGPLWIESLLQSAAGAAVLGTALVVLKYGHGILAVLGATRNGTITNNQSVDQPSDVNHGGRDDHHDLF